jgi:fatty-acyl-CoA synthase
MLAAPADADAARKPWSCGSALPTVDIRLIDAEEQPCKAGEPGEILLKGVQVMRGYWNNPEANRDAWLDGWYRTGDMGVFDEAGHLQIVDRKKNMIITGGVNVYPAEVERSMSTLPGISEVLVFGRPDPVWGERVVAVVFGGGTLEPQGVLDACKPLLGSYKTPKELIVSDRPLPRTTTGKLSRADNDRLYAALADLPRASAAAGPG